MLSLFNFYGQSEADTHFDVAVSFAIDLNDWRDSSDRTVVFLAKYGNLPPAWVEAQDLPRQNNLVRIVTEFVKAASPSDENDTPKEWL